MKDKRIAFLLSGQFRNFEDNVDSVKKNFCKFKNIDFFISTWQQPGTFDKYKIFTLFRSNNGLPLNLINKFVHIKNFQKYILISKDNIYLTRKIQKITPSLIRKLPLKFNEINIKIFNEAFHIKLAKNFIPKTLKEAEPIYYRGFLPMMNRNKEGLDMILNYEKKNNLKYDYIFRSQSEVFFEDNFFEYINPFLIKYDFLYSPLTIDPRYQVSSKLFFGKRNAVVNFLKADDEYYSFINKNLKTDFNKTAWRDIPIGERFFKYIASKNNSYTYTCIDLPLKIIRQKFNPNKPLWILEKNFDVSNFKPIIKYK